MQSDNAYCQAHWQPLPQLLDTDLKSASTTPAFVWADADSCNDMEGCGIAAGDTWLSQTLPDIFNSPAWTTQKSLLILTWDEDGDNSPGGFGPGQSNQVATIVIGSQSTVKAGYQDPNRYDHYSTARVIEGALGLPSMTGNDKWATPYNEVFTGSGASSGNSVTVTDPGTQTATPDQAISPLQIQASDSDSSQTLSYSASGLPAGLSIDSGTGQITGTPTTAGSSSVTVTATDGTGASGSTSFTWNVGSTSTNLIPGGDFESGGLPGWAVTDASVVTDATAHSPTHDLQLNAPYGGYATMEYTVTGLSPNTRYTYSGWVRTGGATTSLGVKHYGGSQIQAHTAATSWTHESSPSPPARASDTSATVFCYLPSGPATSRCDDLSLLAS